MYRHFVRLVMTMHHWAAPYFEEQRSLWEGRVVQTLPRAQRGLRPHKGRLHHLQNSPALQVSPRLVVACGLLIEQLYAWFHFRRVYSISQSLSEYCTTLTKARRDGIEFVTKPLHSHALCSQSLGKHPYCLYCDSLQQKFLYLRQEKYVCCIIPL